MGATFELGTDGPITILVGLDGSETSLRASAYAAGLARRQGASLIVLYVLTTPPIMSGAAVTTGAAMVQSRHEAAAELRDMVEQGARASGIAAEFVLRQGNPYRELIRAARERRVDAIVVGASSKQGHRFVGSLAARLVRDAAWPVTVVP